MPEVRTEVQTKDPMQNQNQTKDQLKTQNVASTTNKKNGQGLTFRRLFTKPGVSPYNEVEWELRTAQITDSQGGMIFEQKNVEVPKDWSMTATNIVASKYLHGQIGTDERETGVRQLVARVAETIRDWGMKDGYFRTSEDAATFHDELVHLLIRQYVAFNSPVWFNVGCDRIEPKSDATNWHWNSSHQPGRVRRHRIHAPAMLRLLHQLGERFARLHPDPGQDRRHALQVGIAAPAPISLRCAPPPKFSAAEAPPAARSAS